MVDDLEPPTFPHLLAALDAFQARLGAELSARAEAAGVRIRGSHGRILHLLSPAGTRPSQLADGWISKQAVGKRIQELAGMGLVVVEPDPEDRRASLVRRTPDGDAVRDRTLAAVVGLEQELREEVGDERYRAFRGVLDELAWPHAPPLLVEHVRSGRRP